MSLNFIETDDDEEEIRSSSELYGKEEESEPSSSFDIERPTSAQRISNGDFIYSDFSVPHKEPRNSFEDQEVKKNRENIEKVQEFERIGIYLIAILIYITATILICMGEFEWLPFPDRWFGIYTLIFYGIFFIISVVGGILVDKYNMNVMYTRKFIHVFSFTVPFVLFQVVPFEKNLTTYSLNCVMLFIAYIPLIEPIRKAKYGKISYYAFKAFDRIDDQPFTLFWAITQSFISFVVLIPITLMLKFWFDAKEFMYITIMTVAFGDGLAEIIGRNFGFHQFRTTAFCTRNVYKRSIEGSLCVFFSCLLTILVVALWISPGKWNWIQITISCMIIPIVMTILEAISPHSWDNGILLFGGGMMTICIFLLG